MDANHPEIIEVMPETCPSLPVDAERAPLPMHEKPLLFLPAGACPFRGRDHVQNSLSASHQQADQSGTV